MLKGWFLICGKVEYTLFTPSIVLFTPWFLMEYSRKQGYAHIAVAPINSWRFYYMIYTQRHLRRLPDNSESYDDNSPLTHADKLQDRAAVA